MSRPAKHRSIPPETQALENLISEAPIVQELPGWQVVHVKSFIGGPVESASPRFWRSVVVLVFVSPIRHIYEPWSSNRFVRFLGETERDPHSRS